MPRKRRSQVTSSMVRLAARAHGIEIPEDDVPVVVQTVTSLWRDIQLLMDLDLSDAPTTIRLRDTRWNRSR
jgi:hypothetical protein